MNPEYNENEKVMLDYVKDKVNKMKSFVGFEKEYYDPKSFENSDLDNEVNLFLKSCGRWLFYIHHYYENSNKKEVENESYKIAIPTTFLRHNLHRLFGELRMRNEAMGFVDLHGIGGACIEYEDIVDAYYMPLDDVMRNEDKIVGYFQSEIEKLEKQLKEKEEE